MKVTSVMGLAVLGLMAGAVGASEMQGQEGKPDFDKLDTDRDGALSAFEVQSDMKLLERFTELDKNGDGKARDPSFEEGIRHSLLQ